MLMNESSEAILGLYSKYKLLISMVFNMASLQLILLLKIVLNHLILI